MIPTEIGLNMVVSFVTHVPFNYKIKFTYFQIRRKVTGVMKTKAHANPILLDFILLYVCGCFFSAYMSMHHIYIPGS